MSTSKRSNINVPIILIALFAPAVLAQAAPGQDASIWEEAAVLVRRCASQPVCVRSDGGDLDDLVFSDEEGNEIESHKNVLGFDDVLLGLATHQRIHEQLFEALGRYRQELSLSVHGRFPTSVFDFFKTWLVTHIMIVDRQYATFKDSLAPQST